MTAITRRNALLSASAAVAVAGVPVAVQADPVVGLVNKALAYRAGLDSIPGDMPDEEFNALCGTLWEMYDQIRLTPATSVEGIAGKVRVAWIQTHPTIEHERNGLPEEFDIIERLAPSRFIWSVLQDFERLIGGMRP